MRRMVRYTEHSPSQYRPNQDLIVGSAAMRLCFGLRQKLDPLNLSVCIIDTDQLVYASQFVFDENNAPKQPTGYEGTYEMINFEDETEWGRASNDQLAVIKEALGATATIQQMWDFLDQEESRLRHLWANTQQ